MKKSMKLEKLSEEQESKLSEYRDKWLKIGLSTDRADRPLCQSIIADVYKVANLEAPKLFIWLESPLEGAIVATFLADSKFGPSVQKEVRDQVWDQVWDQVRDQVWDQVWAQVGAQVWAQVGAQVRDQVGAQVRDQVYKCGYGFHDSEWLGFYEFFLKECGIKDVEELIPLMRLAENCGWWWPFNGAVIFTERPIKIYRNEQFRLHNFDDAAIEYNDGFKLFRFNGVNVPQKYVNQKSFTKEEILAEENADIRREMIRKIGIEEAIKILEAKVLDKKDGYELISLDIGDKIARPYLKMKNPSIDAIHIEGVPAEIKTVYEALAFRNGLDKYYPPKEIT